MNSVTKYFYMKILSLFMVVLGFSYSITSFYNFYSYLYGDSIIANANIYIMSLGLLFPLYTFIFGIYCYFYVDNNYKNINPFILSSGISLLIVGIMRLVVNNGIMQFIHHSYSFVLIVLSSLLIYGCIKYKY